MTIKRDHAARLRALAVDIERLETSLRKAQDKRRDLIRLAADNGGTTREIGEAGRISFQRVQQILTEG